VGVIYLDFKLMLGMISYSTFVSKLDNSGLDRWMSEKLACLLSLKGSYFTRRPLQADFFRDLF